MLIAGAGAAALGCYDDLAGSGSSRGFRGHLGALRQGELTTGAVKLAGIGVTGLAASALLGGSGRGSAPASEAGSGPGGPSAAGSGPGGPSALGAADILINAGLVAGGANLLNLFDLRPGRTIKVALGTGALLAAAPGRGRQAVAAPMAAAAALLPEDLGERAMLGDGGANALGALLGTAAAVTLPRTARVVTLAAIVGLTGASEVVSFTKVIERTRPLRWLDMLGRRPAAARAAAPGAPAPSAAGAGTAGAGTAETGTAGTGAEGDQPESAAPANSAPR